MTSGAADTIRTIVVDDDPAVVRLHTRYLEAVEGFTLAGTVGTGRGAATLAADTTIDLVLLDMNLPDFSGIEVLHRLRVIRDWNVDVIVISSARDSFTVRQAAVAHIVDYLVKPFTKEAFVARLEAYRDARAVKREEVPVRLGQNEIDGLVGGRRVPAARGSGERRAAHPADLPKGLSDATMQVIRATLDTREPVGVADIVRFSGASKATVRRYLDHLVRVGDVDVSHRFGARGRPEVLYRRVHTL